MNKSDKREIYILRQRKVTFVPVKVRKSPFDKKRLKWCWKLPDLRVADYMDQYNFAADPDEYVITVKVENAGGVESDESRVYCNAISFVPIPGVNDIRFQRACDLGQLPPGGTQKCVFRFPLLDMINKDVGKIEVLVDPKNECMECREDNNTESWLWPT